MNWIVPDWIDAPANVGALSTTRRGGVSHAPYDDGNGGGGLNLGVHVGDDPAHVRQNRALLRTQLPAEPAWLSQVHGTTVLNAADVEDAPTADASIATEPGVVCAVQTADCLPVLFCDMAGTVVGAAHAGWRGLAHGVLENTVDRMHAAGAGRILAWLGPAIGPDRFEVGEEVLQVFIARRADVRRAFRPIPDTRGKYWADIYQLARILMRQAGVDHVYGGTSCTVTSGDRFYSYRRDKTTGRMATMIWLKPENGDCTSV